MIIEIDFLKIERSEVREAVMAAFDLLGEKEKGGIFRDDYGIVCKDNPGSFSPHAMKPRANRAMSRKKIAVFILAVFTSLFMILNEKISTLKYCRICFW